MVIFTVIATTTTDNGFIFAILVTIGLKSILSCLVEALLTLILHIICFRTSAPIDSLTYYFLNLALLLEYSDACVILNPVASI